MFDLSFLDVSMIDKEKVNNLDLNKWGGWGASEKESYETGAIFQYERNKPQMTTHDYEIQAWVKVQGRKLGKPQRMMLKRYYNYINISIDKFFEELLAQFDVSNYGNHLVRQLGIALIAYSNMWQKDRLDDSYFPKILDNLSRIESEHLFWNLYGFFYVKERSPSLSFDQMNTLLCERFDNRKLKIDFEAA